MAIACVNNFNDYGDYQPITFINAHEIVCTCVIEMLAEDFPEYTAFSRSWQQIYDHLDEFAVESIAYNSNTRTGKLLKVMIGV